MVNLKEYRVLVTPTSFARDDPQLLTKLEDAVGDVIYNPTDHPLSAEALVNLVLGCDGYIAGLDTIDRYVIEAADRLKIIARYGAGVDRVDLEAAQARGIVVTNTPGANAVSVAELAIGLMISLARSIPIANEKTKRGEWPRQSGTSLQNKTVGIIGLGAIGQQVAMRSNAFDCRVVAHDPVISAVTAHELGVELLPVADVCAISDFLSLHMPVLPSTRGSIDATFLDRMKQGAYLINTARGELVDENALFHALTSGHLRGAALDAFSNEPPDASNPLLSLPNVIATPHTGAHTDGATNAMGWGALNDCLAVLRGEPPSHPVF